MKRSLLIIVLLILTINIIAQTSRRVIKLSGTISDEYPIVMTLAIENNNVLGYYYYEKYKTKIFLEGTINENKITIKESREYETDFIAGFIGELTDDGFNGEWVHKVKDKSWKCALKINTDKLITLSKDMISIDGHYESTASSENYIGSVNLKYIVEDLFSFEISNATESGCVGYMNGLVELKDLKHGIFNDDTCEKIEFQLSGNNLSLTENNCDYHGMRCPFEGKYVKEEL